MDPYAVLGVAPGASSREVAGAYRAAAKRWHPDRGGGEAAQRRMAEVNAAYEMLRRGETPPLPDRQGRGSEDGEVRYRRPVDGRWHRVQGQWLPEQVRWALGPELTAALDPEEDVHLVTPVSTWASPRSVLAVTDRRLLWLHDDAVMGRVRSVRYDAIAEISHRLRRPRRRWAVLRVRTRSGRALTFSEVPPGTAAAIERRVRGAGRT